MQQLPTVLLRHETGQGSHFDWLLGDPLDPAGRLWTLRAALSSEHWASVLRWDLTQLPPHRRQYLTYQGPISANRGSVVRVDEGYFLPTLWTADRRCLDLHLRHCAGRVELRRLPPSNWQAVFQSRFPLEPPENGSIVFSPNGL